MAKRRRNISEEAAEIMAAAENGGSEKQAWREMSAKRKRKKEISIISWRKR
jgi:hypothetical protein